MRIGNSAISKYYVGNTEALKGYLGTNLLFDNSGVPEVDKSLVLSGAGHVDIGSSGINIGDGVSADQPITISFYWKGNPSNLNRLFNRSSGAAIGSTLITNNGAITFALYDGSTSNRIQRTNNSTISSSTWYHITVTYDGSSTREGINIYIDAVLDNGNVASAGSYAYNKNPGSWNIGYAEFLDQYGAGNVDELAIWMSEFNQSQVTELYNGGTKFDLTTHSAGEPERYYKFNDNLTDSSANPVTGTGTAISYSADVP